MIDLNDAEAGMLTSALWTLSDDDGNPVGDDLTVDNFDPATRAELRGDLAVFLLTNVEDLEDSGLSANQIGHNFWLTRNGHGTGFWDRGIGEAGVRLSEACKAFRDYYLDLDSDGLVYGM